MASDYGVYGWERYDGFVQALQILGVTHQQLPADPEVWPRHLTIDVDGYGGTRPLRQIHFRHQDNALIVEEYLAVRDIQYGSHLGLAIYIDGHRPDLHTRHR